MPQWVAQTIAVGVTAPVATGLMYWLASGGDWLAFVGDPGRVTGFAFISVSALVIGLVLGLGTLLREREAQARNLALAFELEREQLERAAVDARLALLTAQIEPHFLFNTLANVQALVESGSPQAAAVLRSLIAYLRAALPRLHEAGLPSLADELALVRAYLELMHMRLPDRLRFEIDIAAELMALRFPPMALLTLVENAVRHGIDPSEDGGTICVGGQFDDQGRVRLWVADSGVGIAESTRTGTGLANLRGRLQGLFGASAQLDLSEQSPSGVRAEISFKPLSERVVAT
jgi:LytS/YehU family sensor histidine kinase